MSTKIEWTKTENEDGSATKGETWNPISGCDKISAGCSNCYAIKDAHRLAGNPNPKIAAKYEGTTKIENGKMNWTGRINLGSEDVLLQPIRWTRPRKIFVNSMSDLFHESVPDEWVDKIFAVIALSPQHTFQILTKRADRMRDYLVNPQTPFNISKAKDEIEVQAEIEKSKEELRQIPNYPNYRVSNFGIVYSTNGSQNCLFCGQKIAGLASKKYCSQNCRQSSHYQRSKGNPDKFRQTLVAMSPDVGEDGHQRVMLYVDGVPKRELVHRLVLSAFDRSPRDKEQGCHKNGNPSNNHIANLRWGTVSDNMFDRKRHGNSRTYAKLKPFEVEQIRKSASTNDALGFIYDVSPTQIRNIRENKQWNVEPEITLPLRNCWLGVSVENQKAADERIPLLLETPASVRWLSCEPLLEKVNLTKLNFLSRPLGHQEWFDALHGASYLKNGLNDRYSGYFNKTNKIDWVVVGGESGQQSRSCDIAWIRSIVRQCQSAGVPTFVKQLGAKAVFENKMPNEWQEYIGKPIALLSLGLKDKKGGDINEFPEDLRVREFPEL